MNTDHPLLSIFQKLFKTGPALVVYQVMMLPDPVYNFQFERAAFELQTTPELLRKQFQELANKQLFDGQQQKNIITAHHQKEREVKQLNQHAAYQLLFANTLQQVIGLGHDKIYSERDICQMVNKFIDRHGQKDIWFHVQKLIPSKTVKQLREYYQKSFQRVLYNNNFEAQDKELIRQLVEKYSDDSPTQITNKFMCMCSNKNYFKRNIVMYIVNLKRK
ncbi:SANT/Myb_domain [Hexamita inflata]|uniref:SANT/Myb domain n=1 Tax=Hexamita inflata TaxID=28002 RepID=A0AA86TWX2_9EUKA|nr:SANT/Myb domain [Hexamita inflata]CAI9931442.1 SANT/Myb domain [Hexamita inflata]